MNTQTEPTLRNLFDGISLGATNREITEAAWTIKLCQETQKSAFEAARAVVEQLPGTPTSKVIQLKDALIKHRYFNS